MAQVDEFESIFRSALVDIYEYNLLEVTSVLLVTDKSENDIKAYLHDVQRFLSVLGTSVTWNVLSEDDFTTTQDLLDCVEKAKPDLVCSYRNLRSEDWIYQHSLGSYLDVLIQQAAAPVLILPHPNANYAHDHAMENTDRVMAITDHLSNDHRLINYALRFTQVDGSVFLTHMEDQAIFDRYMDIISKVPEINTDDAQEGIREQLLKEPQNYIESCKTVLQENNLPVTIEDIVTFGNRIVEYKKLILDHKVDLLIMNAKDHDQLAMHGMAYPLAIELRQIPLLML
ncbi:MAG: hypothetical protein COA45_12215 [Zetaproteobacteria bacterium]|nr:MAG: hypothetical protein COA45_12215 [Zetaproteobacteria bacterium]